jgi:hypothetical protein
MLSQIHMLSIAAAVLLTSPAFARGPLAHAAPAEQVGDQRIIREIVIDGRPIDAVSDKAPANELRPNWLDQSSALDREHQHSWYQHSWWGGDAMFFPVFWTAYIPIVTIILSVIGDRLIRSSLRAHASIRKSLPPRQRESYAAATSRNIAQFGASD